ncbi:hypothetical protein HDV04_003018 [Boothiomyces sp. JEL0838]|nr:hypothetical protein HDV04_003018 [Boothiomyces sp. JEL0838]
MELDLEAIEIQDPELAAWLPLATHGLIKVTDQELSLVNRIKRNLKQAQVDQDIPTVEEQSYSKEEIQELEQKLALLEHQQRIVKQKQEERMLLNKHIMEFNENKTIDLEPLLIKISNKVKESKVRFNLDNKSIQDQVILDYIKAKAWNYYYGGSFCEELNVQDEEMTEIEALQMQNEIRRIFNNISEKLENKIDPETDKKLLKIKSQLLEAKSKQTENRKLVAEVERVKSILSEQNQYSPNIYQNVQESELARQVHSNVHELSVDLEHRLDEYYRFSKTRHFESEPPFVKQTFDEIKEELHQIQMKQKQYADEISILNEQF